MRRRHLVGTGVIVLLTGAAVAASRMAAPLAGPALGFVAKVVCSNVFVAGMSPDRALADLPDEPLARLIRTRVDPETQRVHAGIPLVARREAVHREGFGCTLEPVIAVAPAPSAPPAPPARPASAGLDRWTATPAHAAGNETQHDSERTPGGEPAPGNVTPPGSVTPPGNVTPPGITLLLDSVFAPPADGPQRTRAIVIVQHGRIIAERYAEGFSAGSRFAGWSMAKSVTNALVGILVDDGLLDLQRDALRPEWRDIDDPRARITLGDLLHMSSGLDFDESYTPAGGATRMLFASPDAAATAAASTLVHEPGTHWHYSSATTNLIAALIRDAIGSDTAYHAFPRRALFDRIGMHSAIMEPDPAGTFVGSSFMYATARDWARFGLLFLNDGVSAGERVLPDGWVAYSTTPAPAAPAGRYGAHWWLNAGEPGAAERRPWPELPRDIAYASGFEGQNIVIIPSRDLVIVRLGITRNGDGWDLRSFLRDLLATMQPAATYQPS